MMKNLTPRRHVFFLFRFLKLDECFICFLVLVKKFVLFCFVVFFNFVDANSKKTNIVGEEEQTSTKLANGMGVVMNERGLEGWKMQKHL
jgi:hypothetical protein